MPMACPEQACLNLNTERRALCYQVRGQASGLLPCHVSFNPQQTLSTEGHQCLTATQPCGTRGGLQTRETESD